MEVTLACPRFNRKNDYHRQTPCEQDFLRKFAGDSEVERLHARLNRELPRVLRSLDLFDSDGLFLGRPRTCLFPTTTTTWWEPGSMSAPSCTSWPSSLSRRWVPA